MTRVQPYLFFALSLAALTSGCSESDSPTAARGAAVGCDDEDVGTDCTCADDTQSTYLCSDDELVCDCEPVEDTPVAPPKDAGVRRDAAVKPAEQAPVVVADAGRFTRPDASAPPIATPAPRDAGGVSDPTPTIPVATGGSDPTIPEIKGECPEFKDGTLMIGGHNGVVIKAGAPGKGGPLVFYWHGTGSRPSESSQFAGTSEVIAAGGIVASFDGSKSAKTGMDCSGTGAHNMADFDAADQIVACAVKNHGIDPKRIYTTGCSAGGLQSGCMAQKRSSYIAAAAPNSGGVVRSQAWQDKGTPAIFTMHGGPSDMVIVTFSDTSRTLDMNAKSHGSFVVNCDHGGGHCRAPAELQKSAWQFMKDHPYGATPSPWQSALPAGTPSYCKVF
jgi:predicted esterase